MNSKDALEIVIDLASQNVIEADENDPVLRHEGKEQRKALRIVTALYKALKGGD